MQIRLTGRIESGDPLLETDLRQLSVITTPDGPLLFAASGLNGGISVWNLNGSNGTTDLKTSVYYGVSSLSLGSFTPLETAAGARLVLGGTATGALVFHDMDREGGLSGAETLALPGRNSDAPDALIGTALAKGQAALYGIDAATGQLGGWHLNAAGDVTGEVRLAGKARDFELEQGDLLATARVGKTDFLLAGDAGGVAAYAITNGKGALRLSDTLGTAEGIGIAAPTALEIVTAFGNTWVVLGAAGSQSLTVMRLSQTGTLSPADHVLDTLATRFGGVAAVKVVKTGDHVLVLAGGADDGLSLFTLLPGGRLVHLQSLEHDTGRGLENVSGIDAVVSGDVLRIFVTSTTTPGITELALSLQDLGTLIRPGGADPAARGSSGSDLLLTKGAQRQLDGDGGDDVLVSGTAGGVLTGGEGRDTFVITPAGKTVVITDFEAGLDRLDLSALPQLRSPDQLKVVERGTMVVLEFGGTTVRVETGGAALGFDDLFPDNQFQTPDRLAFPTGPIGRFSQGTGRDDRLTGVETTDIMRGRGGDDHLTGKGGDDRLSGNRGNDVLLGGTGADRLKGNANHDHLKGGLDADRLSGGQGRDRLEGQRGDDVLKGGRGADEFHFGKGHGNDRIVDFNPGQDEIHLRTRTDTFAGLDVSRVGRDTVIDTGAGLLTLNDILPRALDPDDFVFT